MLRKDGIYVQIGTRKWDNGYRTTSNKWYNMLKVLDDGFIVQLGNGTLSTFCEIIDGTPNFLSHSLIKEHDGYRYNHGEITSFFKKDETTPKKILKSINGEFDYHDFLDLQPNLTINDIFKCDVTNNYDIYDMITLLQSIDLNFFLNSYSYGGLNLCRLFESTDENKNEDLYTEENNKDLYMEVNEYSEVTNLVFNDSNTYGLGKDFLYYWYTPSVEEEINGLWTQKNTFPYYFIPFDIEEREKCIGHQEYLKWKNI